VHWLVGDVYFQALRRFWSQTTSALGTPSYAYIFTDPQTSADPALGVFHSSELFYLFRDMSKNGPPKSAQLSRAMLDYWISFAVSLTPNDGKGTKRMLWDDLIYTLPRLLLLTGSHWEMYNETKVWSNRLLIGKRKTYMNFYSECWSSLAMG